MIKKRNLETIARPVSQGGTGVKTVLDIKDLFGVYEKANYNQPNQLIALDSVCKISDTILTTSIQTTSLSGYASVFPDTVNIYKIQNYSSFMTYSVSVSAGSFAVSENTITYTSPSVPGPVTITVNGTVTTLNVLQPTVSKPTINSPVNGNINVGVSVVAASSSFLTDHTNPNHASSSWEVSRFSNFSTLFASSYNDTVNKINYTITGMALNTQYYVRVKHKDVYGNESPWSDGVNFTTRSAEIIEVDQMFLLQRVNSVKIGECIALSPDKQWLLITSPNDTFPGSTYGRVIVYKKMSDGFFCIVQNLNQGETQSVTSELPVVFSPDGTRFAIGQFCQSYTYGSVGTVYIYKLVNGVWTQEAVIYPSSPVGSMYFGRGMAFNADATKILIGAAGDTNSGRPGSFYVYNRTGSSWAYGQVVFPSITAGAMFGYQLIATPDFSRIFVGAPKGTVTRSSTYGAVFCYRYENGSFVQEAYFETDDASINRGYGVYLATNDAGDVLAVSQNYTPLAGTTGIGYVFIYKRTGTTWTFVQKITTSASGTGFGVRLKMSSTGKYLFIGEQKLTGSYAAQGAVWLYERSGDTYISPKKIDNPTPEANSYFGSGIEYDDTNSLLYVNSWADSNALKSVSSNVQGSIHVFKRGF